MGPTPYAGNEVVNFSFAMAKGEFSSEISKNKGSGGIGRGNQLHSIVKPVAADRMGEETPVSLQLVCNH